MNCGNRVKKWRCPTSGAQRIVLIGASVRAAAESLSRAGFQVVGMDLFQDTDARQACDSLVSVPTSERELDRFCQSCVGLPVLCVGEFNRDPERGRQPNLDQVLGRLAVRSSILGVSLELRSMLRETQWLCELAGRSEMNFPMTLTESEIDESELSGHRWLIKRDCSSGGLGVRRWTRETRTRLHSQARLQQWIPGKAYGATLLSDGTNVGLLGVCRSLFIRCGTLPFVYAGNDGPVALPKPICDSIRRLGSELVAETGIRGLFNVDLIVDPSGVPWLLEINPRWSASSELVERQWRNSGSLPRNGSLLAEAIKLIRGDGNAALLASLETHEMIGADSRHLKRVIYARRDLKFSARGIVESLGPGESVHDVPEQGKRIRTGEPVLTWMVDLKKSGPINYRARLRSVGDRLETQGDHMASLRD